jgi:hypothetical protein
VKFHSELTYFVHAVFAYTASSTRMDPIKNVGLGTGKGLQLVRLLEDRESWIQFGPKKSSIPTNFMCKNYQPRICAFIEKGEP